MKRKAVLLYATCLFAISVTMSCADKSRRAEIEQRNEALVHKQDSALAEAQQRLTLVDSMLEVAKAEHDKQHEWVMSNSTKLKDNSPEVLRLNQLRAHRDSLQVEWETLGAKIKYIRKKQNKE
jgi:hypothetical protein